MHSHSEIRKSALTIVRVEQAELLENHAMVFDELKEVAEAICQFYVSIRLATTKALER